MIPITTTTAVAGRSRQRRAGLPRPQPSVLRDGVGERGDHDRDYRGARVAAQARAAGHRQRDRVHVRQAGQGRDGIEALPAKRVSTIFTTSSTAANSAPNFIAAHRLNGFFSGTSEACDLAAGPRQ